MINSKFNLIIMSRQFSHQFSVFGKSIASDYICVNREPVERDTANPSTDPSSVLTAWSYSGWADDQQLYMWTSCHINCKLNSNLLIHEIIPVHSFNAKSLKARLNHMFYFISMMLSQCVVLSFLICGKKSDKM